MVVIIIVDYVGRLRIKVMKLLTTYMSIEHYLCKSKPINISLYRELALSKMAADTTQVA